MSDKGSPTRPSNQDDGHASARSEASSSGPKSQSNPAPSDSAPAPANAADDNRTVIDITRSPPPTATPAQSQVIHPPAQPPQQILPQTPQQQQPPRVLQPYPQNGPPTQQNVHPAPQPIHPINQSPLPPPPPSYVVHSQAPLLMDKCPRCQFVPTLQQGQQRPPLPPYGSYLPANLYPPPPRWQQAGRPQPPPPPPPPPPQQQPQPQSPSQPQSQSPWVPPTPSHRNKLQVPPEFRSTKYFPGWGNMPPPPPHIRAHMISTSAHANGLPATNIPDYLPDDPNGYVLEPFIPPPKYAPIPSTEAIAFLAPKWPKPKQAPKAPTDVDGETRREKQRRVGRQRMTRDDRCNILLMRRLGYQFESIARFLGTTISSCHYTCRKGTPEVAHKNAGRRVRMPPEIITRMCEYVKEYQKQERAAGKDKKTGKRKMAMLTYNMIRDNVFKDVNGEIPQVLKYTDDALKQLLNKYGLWLRQPMSQARKEEGRARGIKQWKDKLAKDRAEAQRLAAEATAAGEPVSEELAARANGTASALAGEEPGSDMEGYGSPGEGEDEEMGDAFSATDDTPSDNDNDNDEDDDDEEEEGDESMQIEDQLRQAIAAPENYR